MKKNMGFADRVIRLLIAAFVVILYSMGIISGWLGIALLIVAGVFALTSFISSCPIYSAFGLNSCSVKKE